MRTHLSTVSNVVLTLCALFVTGLVVRREFFPSSPDPVPETRSVADWRKYTEFGNRIGPADALVTIVEFSDFQCPACRAAFGRLQNVRSKYPDQVAILYRHLPLPNHPHALGAARASNCAAEQGRFEAYHDALFTNQQAIGEVSWAQFADSAAVADKAAFARCLEQPQTQLAIQRDQDAAKQLGIRATPTLLINDRLVVGALSEEELQRWVEEALRAESATR